jgi:hypothetical protein
MRCSSFHSEFALVSFVLALGIAPARPFGVETSTRLLKIAQLSPDVSKQLSPDTSKKNEPVDDYTLNTRTPLGGAPTTRDVKKTREVPGIIGNRAASTFSNSDIASYGNLARPLNGRSPNGLDPRAAFFPSLRQDTSTPRANSGYGIPNGARPSHMDATGTQRVN